MKKIIDAAFNWVLKQKVEYGEVTLKFIFHDGQLRQIERDLKEKIQVSYENRSNNVKICKKGGTHE